MSYDTLVFSFTLKHNVRGGDVLLMTDPRHPTLSTAYCFEPSDQFNGIDGSHGFPGKLVSEVRAADVGTDIIAVFPDESGMFDQILAIADTIAHMLSNGQDVTFSIDADSSGFYANTGAFPLYGVSPRREVSVSVIPATFDDPGACKIIATVYNG